jgi:hypothetical protein
MMASQKTCRIFTDYYSLFFSVCPTLKGHILHFHRIFFSIITTFCSRYIISTQSGQIDGQKEVDGYGVSAVDSADMLGSGTISHRRSTILGI